VRAAGGEVTDCTGAPIDYLAEDTSHPRGLVASSILGVNTVTERLGPHAHRWFSVLRRG
jgi:3'-phosphoadenosine 5'-phosphosulfate (PAPS) 3'-phosphatase